MQLSQAQAWLREVLPEPEAKREAEWMLRHLLGVGRAYLLMNDHQQLTDDQVQQLGAWQARRAQGEPLAYLLGQTEFYGLPLSVSPAVLIPRADTELLVDLALAVLTEQTTKTADASAVPRVLDMGTGSGAIAIALASHCQQCQVFAIDVSTDALSVARQNALDNGVEVHFQQSHWFSQLEPTKFALIVSNPPYIADNDPHLGHTGLPFEPIQALTSGADGLDAIRELAQEAPKWLVSGGYLLLEHGYDQAQAVRACLQDHGFTQIQTFQDLGENDRVTQAVYLAPTQESSLIYE